MLRAYELIGYEPERDYRYVEINRALRQAHPGTVSRILHGIGERCGQAVQDSDTDLIREIGNLRKRGYNDRQIANKIGVAPDYVGMIAGLLERGDERLVSAVETGLLPLNLAIDISKTDAEGGQRALMDAYTQKKLRGKKLAAVRRLIQLRDAQGPHLHRNRFGRRDGAKRPLTSDSLVRAYQQEAERQKLLIKKAELTQCRLFRLQFQVSRGQHA